MASTTSCSNFFTGISDNVDQANTELIDNITDAGTQYKNVCVQTDVTYEHYMSILKPKLEKTVEQFQNSTDNCKSAVKYLQLANQIRKLDIDPTMITTASSKLLGRRRDKETSELKGGLDDDREKLYENIAEAVSKYLTTDDTNNEDITDSFHHTVFVLAKLFVQGCQCNAWSIVAQLGKHYKKRFTHVPKERIKHIVKEVHEHLQTLFYQINNEPDLTNKSEEEAYNIISVLVRKLTMLHSFSIENELQEMIPDDLGSIKKFFIKLLSTYYSNIHPVVWAQILKECINNFLIDLPVTSEEVYQFFSKHILLNSGPFILKMLQLIQPLLTPELAIKYNLTKLKYPTMNNKQVKLVLNKILTNPKRYSVLRNISASVGHVCIVQDVMDPANVFVIKIIKPIAIAQSCWEFKALYDIFPIGSCEQEYIKRILESNGSELNVKNEIENLDNGYKYYTANYDIIKSGLDPEPKLTTIQNQHNIVRSDCWYALAMTLAPGVPLSSLTESNQLGVDTKFRANLFRCLDILVYKFFYNIVHNGFYHGDLHAGNIFYSYGTNTMTLIDFGAVNNINVTSTDAETMALIILSIKASFYNYDEILDVLTELVNNKCPETRVDPTTQEYRDLRNKLSHYHVTAIKNQSKITKSLKEYEEYIFSDERIAQEKPTYRDDPKISQKYETIYSYLEYTAPKTVAIEENRDMLPVYTYKNESVESPSLENIMGEIIKFYSKSGVNIAVKLSGFAEFQKSYFLLQGVLKKANYPAKRANIIIGKALVNYRSLSVLTNVSFAQKLVTLFAREALYYKKIEKQLNKSDA